MNQVSRLLDHVVVTGAGRGLGAALARSLVARGARVTLVARTASEVHAVAAAIGEDSLALPADVSRPDQVSRVIAQAREQFGPPTTLVNNAAILGPIAPLWKTDPEEWQQVQRVNVFGAYLCLRAILPLMIEGGRGQVLGISSGAAVNTIQYHSAYNTSKAGFEHLHRMAQAEVVDKGLALALLEPGGIDTRMMGSVLGAEFPDAQLFRRFHDEGLLLQPEQVAEPVADLLQGGVEPGRRYHIDELLDGGTG